MKLVKPAYTQFPFWAFLVLYTKAGSSCTMEYNKGTQALVSWLSSRKNPFSFSAFWDSRIEDDSFVIPTLLQGYETYELAKILAQVEGSEINRMHRIIYTTMIKLVDKRML